MDVYSVPVPTCSKKTYKTWHYPLAFGTFLHRSKGVRLPDWIAKHPDFNGLVTEEMQAIKRDIGELANPLHELELVKRAM